MRIVTYRVMTILVVVGWLLMLLTAHPVGATTLAPAKTLVYLPGVTTPDVQSNVQPQGKLPTPLDSSWHLTWADEFNGSSLNTTNWTPNLWGGVANAGNNEQQIYTPAAVTSSNGLLHLQATQQSLDGYSYTSGVINSYGKFAPQYGYFEMRAKLPRGKGFWPAFWLFPESGSGPAEIDTFESLGNQTNTVYMTNHWQSATGASAQSQTAYVGPDFSQDFHTFAVKWTPTELVSYIDGVERARSTQGVPTQPMYLIVNLAVGGHWPGNPDATTPFPSSFDVDYIRVYQQP